ncbi:MAG: hypothetical protein ABIQ35_09195 [Verrucomicrobiota bacterium]
MKCLPILAVLFAVSILGCHKEKPAPSSLTPDSSSQSTPVPDSNVSAPPTKSSGKQVPPPQAVLARAENGARQNVVGDEDPFLTQQLQIFVQQKQRMPESFAEFAATRLDSIPRPPAGKKWVIDSGVLQVKAVEASK